MCFSPVASFVASGGLALIGTATLKETKSKREFPLASFPMLFAIQQFAEGWIWLSFAHPDRLKILTYIFASFSHVLWPFYVPLAVYLVEPDRYRKRVIAVFLLLGILVSAYVLYFIIQWPIEARITQNSISFFTERAGSQPSIQYLYFGDYPAYTFFAYLVAVTMAPFFSSYRIIKIFGGAIFFSAYLAYSSYEHSFFSVWCFFAAMISTLIYLHFALGRKTIPDKILHKIKTAKKIVREKVRRKLKS